MHSDLKSSSAIAQSLRDLPAELPPPLSWTQFQHRMNRKPVSAWRYAMLAAGLAALVAGVAVWSRVSPPRSVAHIVTTSQAELPMFTLPDPRSIEQSKASERWLTHLP